MKICSINAPDVDCIGIFTQRHLHGPMVVKALKQGKNVYSAVPIGCTIEEIQEIINIVKDTRQIYMMGETCYYYPCAMFCREKYKSGEMGKFVYGESQYYHDICEMYNDFKHSAVRTGAELRHSADVLSDALNLNAVLGNKRTRS